MLHMYTHTHTHTHTNAHTQTHVNTLVMPPQQNHKLCLYPIVLVDSISVNCQPPFPLPLPLLLSLPLSPSPSPSLPPSLSLSHTHTHTLKPVYVHIRIYMYLCEADPCEVFSKLFSSLLGLWTAEKRHLHGWSLDVSAGCHQDLPVTRQCHNSHNCRVRSIVAILAFLLELIR